MSKDLRRRPSAALIVAIAALVVAASGTTYATVALPKSSVGTAQLKANAVTGAKVKDGSLLRADFRAADRAKLVGPQGPQGPQGAPGAPGTPGTPGAPGPSAATLGHFDAGRLVPFVAELGTLPAGSYVLTLSAQALSDSGTSTVNCSLKAAGGTIDTVSATATAGGLGASLALVGAAASPGAGLPVSIECLGPPAGRVGEVRLAAVQVGTLTDVVIP